MPQSYITKHGGFMQKSLTTDEVQEVLKRLQNFLEDAKGQWATENPTSSSWVQINKTNLVNVTVFLLNKTDDLIQYVETFISYGPDKKAAALLILAKLFDSIAGSAFPIWIKPFVPTIKQILINIVLGNLIDFIVSKYKGGFWKMEQNDATK